MPKPFAKILLLIFLLTFIALFFGYGLERYLTLQSFQNYHGFLTTYYTQYPLRFILGYMGIYIMLISASLPGSLVMTIAGSLFFGTLLGGILAVTSATIGATIACLCARYIFRECLEKKYHSFFEKINQGIHKEGIFYLFFVRFFPFPFFIVNSMLGLTRIRLSLFILTTFIGMSPSIFIYAYSANKFSQVNTASELLSPNNLMIFGLIGCTAIIPLILKKIWDNALVKNV